MATFEQKEKKKKNMQTNGYIIFEHKEEKSRANKCNNKNKSCKCKIKLKKKEEKSKHGPSMG